MLRAVLTLLLLPWRRTWLLTSCAVLIAALGVFIAAVSFDSPRGVTGGVALMAFGFASAIWHIGAGMALATICRAESFLMPRFARGLKLSAAVDVVLTIALPAAVVIALGGGLALAPSVLLAAGSVGLSIGLGSRIGIWIWLAMVASSVAPGFSKVLVETLSHSRLTPLLLALSALVLLRSVLRPLFRRDDTGSFVSPLELATQDRRPGMDALSHQRPLRGIGGKIKNFYDRLADWRLQRVLARGPAARSRHQRLALVRALLLPNDHLAALVVQWLFALVFVAFFAFSVSRNGSRSLFGVGYYLVFLASARFAQVQRGLLLLRPSLTDLYLAAAPRQGADFHALIADALMWLLTVATASAAVYAALVAWMLGATEPAAYVTAVASAAFITAMIGLALCLMTQHGVKPRPLLMTFLTALAGSIAFTLTSALTSRFGALPGAGLALALAFPFALGFYLSAREAALRQPLVFDPPL